MNHRFRIVAALALGQLLLVLTASFLPAQDGPGGRGPGSHQAGASRHEKMESLRVGFLTRRMNLTTAEAEGFWPVYNTYRDSLQALHRERRRLLRAHQGGLASMSDREIEAALDRIKATRTQEADLKAAYYERFKEVLPIRKVAQLYRAEHDFKRILLERLREHRRGRKGRNGAGRSGAE
jgi:Spy/CpxP family protein refolding chaperone